MKRIYSTITMLAMMVAVLSFTACGDDDDEVLYDSGDFIEVTIDGKTYHKKMIGIYSEMEIGDNDMVVTGMAEDVFDDDGFLFFMSLTHSEKKDKLLSLPLGNYGVDDNPWADDEPENLCFYPIYEKNRHEYILSGGSHQVTSIKQNKGGVQICGKFKVTMYYNDESVVISGKYGMTVSVY